MEHHCVKMAGRPGWSVGWWKGCHAYSNGRWLGFHQQGSVSPGFQAVIVVYTLLTRGRGGLGPQLPCRCSGTAATATPLQNECDARPAPRPAARHRSTSPFRSSNAQRAGPWASLMTVGCNGGHQLYRLTCYRPLSWIPTLSPNPERACCGTARGLAA